MEGELWNGVYGVAMDLARKFRSKHTQIPDAWIVLTYLWAVLHDRPVSWACQTKHWPPQQIVGDLPSAATMSRRLKTAAVQNYFTALSCIFRGRFSGSWCKWIDALPLPVGGASQDREARIGWGAGILSKGYKFHAICDSRAGVEAWAVYPMNVPETKVASQLLCRFRGEGYLVADGEYDRNHLYDEAAASGFQLVARKRPGAGLGHRRHSEHRMRSLELTDHAFGQYLLQQRFGIDRFFGQWGNWSAGLKPLPHWVRGLHRVRLWVHGKIILNAARLALKQRLIA
jgi:hypothetical protein